MPEPKILAEEDCTDKRVAARADGLKNLLYISLISVCGIRTEAIV